MTPLSVSFGIWTFHFLASVVFLFHHCGVVRRDRGNTDAGEIMGTDHLGNFVRRSRIIRISSAEVCRLRCGAQNFLEKKNFPASGIPSRSFTGIRSFSDILAVQLLEKWFVPGKGAGHMCYELNLVRRDYSRINAALSSGSVEAAKEAAAIAAFIGVPVLAYRCQTPPAP